MKKGLILNDLLVSSRLKFLGIDGHTFISESDLDNLTYIHSGSTNVCLYHAYYCGHKVFLKEFRVDSNSTVKQRYISEAEFYHNHKHISMTNLIGHYTLQYPIVYMVFEYYTMTTLSDCVKEGRLVYMNDKLKTQLVSKLAL